MIEKILKNLTFRAFYCVHNFLAHPLLLFDFWVTKYFHDTTYDLMFYDEIPKRAYNRIIYFFLIILTYCLPFLVLGFLVAYIFTRNIYTCFELSGVFFILHLITFDNDSDNLLVEINNNILTNLQNQIKKLRTIFNTPKNN